MMSDPADLTMQIKEKIHGQLKKIQTLSMTNPKMAKVLAEETIKQARDNGLKHQEASGLIWYAHVVTGLVGDPAAIESARRAVELLSDSSDELLIARAYTVFGNCLKIHLFLTEALIQYQSAMNIYKKRNDLPGVSTVLNNIASTYKTMGLYEEAFSAFTEAITILDDSEYLLSKAAAINNLATLLVERDNPKMAENYLMKALDLHRKAGSKEGEGLCLRDIGKLKAILKEYSEAEKYYRQALSVLEEISSQQYMGYTLFLLSQLKEDQGHLKEAENCLVQAVEISKSSQSPRKIADAKHDLAALRIRMGKSDQSESPMFEFLKYLTDTGDDLESKSNVYASLTMLHELKQDYKKALEYHKEKSKVDRQLETAIRENDVVRIRLRTEFQRSENERKLLEAQKMELRDSNEKLSKALDRIKKLSGLLPICSYCKNIRDDQGYWNQIESYIAKHSDTEFSHGICPKCAKKHFPTIKLYQDQ